MGRQIRSKIGRGAAGAGIRGSSRITSKGLGCANNSLMINQVFYQDSLMLPQYPAPRAAVPSNYIFFGPGVS